ncbi:mannose-1-phosphate guanylyltransferase [Bacillus sp. SA1-12]|uniref:sugar phosphate nucleotidyltransferase n=1 Tax=Bacillus sp. SA1-12 TaxID=1455638 RepID=UPI000625B1B3|nr:sugar phosphate nucleotidyltransferase [Bacillus sp. SA1-12]KKI93242.1 mannose-1-phosphate guanylyltransferase [Bacillus sp. SA1-12]
MKLILLSGGSGSRLWPLSNNARSKQFLKVLKNEQQQLESMVQRVWGQLNTVGLADSTIIATSKSQVDMIQSQLNSQADLVIEPVRRDTFPAIVLAASYLYSVKNASLDEVVSVLPVDPFVEASFFERMLDMEEALNSSQADIALMGVQPTFPSEKYGYIVPEAHTQTNDYRVVNRFVEKPKESHAAELMEDGALWNCGVFSFKLEYIINLLKEKGLPTNYDELLEGYGELPKISFDYEVVEKAEKIVVLPYDGYWKDLGTWNTLTEEMAAGLIGKGQISPECDNTHLINELDIPVVVMGLSNVVVAASPDGILVTEKSASPRVKEVVANLVDRPMYEERRWGWYKVLDHSKFDGGNEVLTKRIGVKAGKNLSYQFHHQRSEVWTIVKGEGVLVLNGKMSVVRPNDVIQINKGEYHALKAVTDLELIEVQSGSELIEEDIVRVMMNWDEIEELCYASAN